MNLKFTLTCALVAAMGMPALALSPKDSAPVDNVEYGKLPANYASRIKRAAQKRVNVSDYPLSNPTGETEAFTHNANALVPFNSSLMRMQSIGVDTKVCYGFKKDAYVFQPISQYPTRSYVAGDIDESKDKYHPDIIVPLPQPILDYKNSTGSNIYYIDRLAVSVTASKVSAFVEDDKDEIRYVWTGDHYELLNDTEDGMIVGLGMIDPEDNWIGYLDYNVTLTPLTDRVNTPPAKAVEAEEWALQHGDGANGFMVKVLIDGDNFWMQGVGEKILPEAWVKGKIVDGSLGGKKVVFPGAQFMGIHEGYQVYFCAYKSELVWNEAAQKEEMGWVIPEQAEFAFDPSINYLSCDSRTALGINAGKTQFYYFSIYQSPEISMNMATDCFTPSDPVILAYNNNPGASQDFACAIHFTLPRTNINNQMLKSENMSYKIFVDDDPFCFYTDEYVRLTSDMEEIPYFFTDEYDIALDQNTSTNRRVYFYAYDMGDHGIMSIYTDPATGDRYYSNITYRSGNKVVYTDGVKNTIANGNVVSSEYFDMEGRRVANPAKGLYVRRSVMDNGNVSVEKVILK